MAKGLQFNPYNGTNNTTSIPTVANDYFLTQRGNNLNVKWDPSQVNKLNSIINWATTASEDEKKAAYNPTYELEVWDKGLNGLSEEDRLLWERQNKNKIQDLTESEKDRVWRNQQFINSPLGLETFNALKGRVEDRDKLFEDYLTEKAVRNKYGRTSNLQQILELTPTGRRELLSSDYQADSSLNRQDEEAETKDWLDYSLGERLNAISSKVAFEGTAGAGLGSVVGSMIVIGSIPGAVLGGIGGAIKGTASGIVHPEDAKDVNQFQRKSDNEEILNNITIADNERKKAESKEDIDNLFLQYLNDYQNRKLSVEKINDLFDGIALNQKKSTTDELGNTNQENYIGSSFYTAFKDTDEFEHFSTIDKLRYLAQTKVLANKYGQNSAISILDQDMQNYISDNQSARTWGGNTLKNVWVGGLANLGMNVAGLGALYTQLAYGEEGLAEYLKGKNPDGSGEDVNLLLNPHYWNKVDQYNDLGIDLSGILGKGYGNHIAEAEANGGISTSNNVYKPGSENDFWSWSTLNESVKMNKFAWSDLLKNLALGKLVRGATRLFGGVEVAPGVLATESTALSKFVNKAGALGVLNASSLGIDTAYGMQTYEEVLRENNEKLDAVIQKDVDTEVQRRIQTPEAQKEFKEFVDAENKRRKAQAGERGSYIKVDEAQAWADYINYTEKKVREEQEALHAEDRKQAENDAANAYVWDASIEHLRMATTNGVFKSYLFDKGTLNALKGNNPYVATTTKGGQYALAKHATLKKALGTAGMNIWGGFHSNYFDDVTVGFAKGFGIQDYNNYLLQKYNPAAYGNIIDDYVSPYLAGMAGATNAMTEKRSFLDGAIGAVGSLFTFSPNVHGMMSHKERMKELAESIEKSGDKKQDISWQESWSDFINNPILQAVADAKAATRATEAELKRRNDILKENGYAFDNMVETMSALNSKAITREGTSVLEAEDAKDREAFSIASSLLSMKNSDVVSNAQAEPDKATWSKKKKAAHYIGRGLNALIGVPIFTEAESSYTNAMQTLEDASTIGETNNEETIERQQQLIQTFLGLDANKNALQGMSEEEKVAFAQERLKKNATGLLDMMNRTEKLQKKFAKSIQAHLHPDMQQQLIYQYVLNDRWENRSRELKNWITKEEDSTPNEGSSSLIAKYGSQEGYERTKKAQEKKVAEAQSTYDKAQIEDKKDNDPTKSHAENVRLKAIRKLQLRQAEKTLNKEKAALVTIEKEGAELKNSLNSETPVISAYNILRLNADDRLRMLDDFYREDYSEAQQAEIDKAKNILIEDGTTINEAMEKVRDAAVLKHRIEDNMEVAKSIMKNPIEANYMQQALQENRKRKVIDYFNDKIVAEALNDFINTPEAIISDEKATEKARNYSTAVLNGMLRAIEKETAHPSKEDVSLKTLSILEDGIKNALKERDDKAKETLALDSYLKKTKKVNHTHIEVEEGAPEDAVDPNTGDIKIQFAKAVTEERELSQNDKKLIETALDYAAERGISIDELLNRIGTEDFNTYIQERNHAYQLTMTPYGEVRETNVGTPENMVNPVSPEYAQSLLKDVIDSFKVNQEKVKTATEEKTTSNAAESVATSPVETNGAKLKPGKEEEVRPDKVDSSDPLGLKKKKEAPKPIQNEASESTIETSERNKQVLEVAERLNQSILEDVRILLNEVDKMQMAETTREKLKDIMSSHLTSTVFTNIQALQNRIAEEAMFANQEEAPMIDTKATALSSIDIADIKARKKAKVVTPKKDSDSSNSQHPLPPQPSTLETRDLDALMKYPIWADFIKLHNVVGFLHKLSEVWHKDYKEKGPIHQSQAVFIYDPVLAEAIKKSIESKDNKKSTESESNTYNPEIDAPILMALEITDKNKYLIENENQLITIKEADNKEHKYQVIGIMPSSHPHDNDSNYMKSVASRMAAIRKRINFNSNKTHTLRYTPDKDTGKYNGGQIKTNISNVSSHTEEDSIPHATAVTPKKNVQQLMDENVQSTTEVFVKISEEEKQIYEEAKAKGPVAVRATDLYKKLKKAFIERLIKRERETLDPDTQNNKELDFKVQKGTHDTFPKIVLTKKISETFDKNTGRPIVELLREIDNKGSNASEVIESNSRFKRLFNQLSSLKIPQGLFDAKGNIVNKSTYNKTLAEFADSIKNALENNLKIDDVSVKVEISEGIPTEKVVRIHVYSGDVNNANSLLSTLTTLYTEKLSQPEFVNFIKDLIIDSNGNTRQGIKDSRFERVKWQVNYEDAEVVNDKNKTESEKKPARDNLEDLYDDGVFEMQTTKLAYPARSVTVDINNKMQERLYYERKAEPQTPAPKATETKAAFEAETPTGKVDGDTGMRTEAEIKQEKESILTNPKVKKTLEIVKKMISDSKDRNTTLDDKYYSIAGQIWARVTSIKHAIREGLREFTNKEGEISPALYIGDSFDDFYRDAINGIFDNMSPQERQRAFENYDNATKENYEKVYMAFKAFEVRLLDKGQVLIPMGNSIENRGKITSKGYLNVTVRNADGTIETRKIRVAGTIDAIAVDKDGNLYLYDFKTHRVEYPLTEKEAINNGYDIQQSEYAEFLEAEYNLKEQGINIKSINIIPAAASYPNRRDHIFEKGIGNQLKIAKKGDTSNNGQPAFEPLRANLFDVESEFELPRLSQDELTAAYEKLSEEDKKALVEIIQDQSEHPANEVSKTDDIITSKPEISEDTTLDEEENEGGFSRKGRLGRRRGVSKADTSTEAIDQAINPNDKKGILSRMDELKKSCGGKKV